MLPSLETAHCVNGPMRKKIAADCNVSTTHLYNWLTGRHIIPKHRRQSIERAFGTPVDWAQYQVEFDACNRPADGTAEEPKKEPVGWFTETFWRDDDHAA